MPSSVQKAIRIFSATATRMAGCHRHDRPFASIEVVSLIATLFLGLTGCNFFPDVRKKPQYHNPFPQIQTVAILPFRNQSQTSTLDVSRVTLAYYNELQSVPGFEVLPVGLIENQLAEFERNVIRSQMTTTEDLQRFAEYLGVDVILHGSVTDFDQYYPPRMTLKVNWYAANPGFHPIPPGYGLPWGTKDEKQIPNWIRLEAERALAREQLATQTPIPIDPKQLEQAHARGTKATNNTAAGTNYSTVGFDRDDDEEASESIYAIPLPLGDMERNAISMDQYGLFGAEDLPIEWPDPQGFVPQAPRPVRPRSVAQSEPIISHMRAYNGNDEDFTQALSDYYYFRDEARFGGWESYLQRSEDFIRFCCHLHIVETLAQRGGQLKSRTIVRWPINRYER